MQTIILDASQIEKKITRIAYEIYEEHADDKEIVLAGVVEGGYALAQKISLALKKISPLKVTLLKININKKTPSKETAVSVDKQENLSGKTIILVDDVLNTGKILSYSMKIFLQSPVKSIRVAVLVDRNHSQFPIKADYSGISIATTLQEHITVNLEAKGKESVILKD
ncbi:MAG TPA: phosphoribosyltransferase family protein [Bacteroidia bacterium]|jgi:pyrimidine operon attenuation protein/uracil phosphoribosyltransferase|nr:phosphoribosyltransferase family protein [Bacteroidia bacterium]